MSVRRLGSIAVMVVATTTGASVTAAAAAPRRSGRVGPNQVFVGMVNGSTGAQAPAQIRVACPGPVRPGETTHPLQHQTLEVSPPASTAQQVGTTGPDGNEITAYLGIPPTAASGGLATFTRYGRAKPIPTSVNVPCEGTGFVTFVPFPRDPGGARAFVVPVEYVNIAV
jgi:hypothetical protein